MKKIQIKFSPKDIERKVNDIINFIKNKTGNEKVVIAVSGGLDSDVVVRLAEKAVGKTRIKIFIVIQKDIEYHHLQNARELALELGIKLIEITIPELPYNLIKAMETADVSEGFNSSGLLDPARAKCSIRTAIFSTYQDRDYVVIGTSNKTEYETGFFLPFGDGIAHIKPIIHLYKTQVVQIAKYIGTNPKVIKQPASAGFWKGQTDLEDLAYWIFNEEPIKKERNFTSDEINKVNEIKIKLNTELIDIALYAFSNNCNDFETAQFSKLPVEIIEKLRKLTIVSVNFKHRNINERIKE